MRRPTAASHAGSLFWRNVAATVRPLLAQYGAPRLRRPSLRRLNHLGETFRSLARRPLLLEARANFVFRLLGVRAMRETVVQSRVLTAFDTSEVFKSVVLLVAVNVVNVMTGRNRAVRVLPDDPMLECSNAVAC